MIDKSKQYRTRDGREVRIYAVDGCGEYNVHGAYKNEAGWVHGLWKKEGAHTEGVLPYALDLIEVKPRIKREVWVNVYPHNGVGQFHLSKAQADMNADVENRIACVKLTIDCEEGTGL